MRFIQQNIFLYFFLLILGISGFFFAIIWPETIGFYAFITFASSGGLGVAIYIYYTKKNHKQLVCSFNSDCNIVITSRYSKFLGISLEYWGMFYYSVIFTSYIILIFAPYLLPKFFLSGLIMFSATAFLFSLYLLFAQAFLLRQWCIWCLLSAMLSITIFITSLVSLEFAVTFLTEITTTIETIHALGFALGIGGATAALFLFSRFLSDLNIDENELRTLKGISELVWLGLALIVVSQFALFVSYPETLAETGPFLAQTIALFVVIISGAILMIIFAPFLALIPFNETEKDHQHSPLETLRRPLFFTGAVALSSWYFAFTMNHLSEYGLPVLFSGYVVILVCAITIALLWENRIKKGTL